MRTMLRAVALATALPLVAPAMGAQMPGPGHGPAVTFLLAHTGQLQLNDQQVVKLAAIARRAAERHKAMHASFDSLRAQFRRGGDSGMRHREGPPPELRATMEKERDANHADLRDALAVLTPDQQASAWELVSHPRILMRHRGPGREGGEIRFRARSMQRGGEAMIMQDDGEDEAFDAPSADDDR
jgi:LTXXQ motif family protein